MESSTAVCILVYFQRLAESIPHEAFSFDLRDFRGQLKHAGVADRRILVTRDAQIFDHEIAAADKSFIRRESRRHLSLLSPQLPPRFRDMLIFRREHGAIREKPKRVFAAQL